GETLRLREDRAQAARRGTLRGVLRETARAPARGGVGVLRHRRREGRGAPEDRRALSEARGREVHRDLLGAHPAVAAVARGAGCAGPGPHAEEEEGDRVKLSTGWHSERLGERVGVARWGTFGTPVVLFPTAGGDAEEIERFHVIDSLKELID